VKNVWAIRAFKQMTLPPFFAVMPPIDRFQYFFLFLPVNTPTVLHVDVKQYVK